MNCSIKCTVFKKVIAFKVECSFEVLCAVQQVLGLCGFQWCGFHLCVFSKMLFLLHKLRNAFLATNNLSAADLVHADFC